MSDWAARAHDPLGELVKPAASVHPTWTEGHTVAIAIAGELDAATVELVRRHIKHALSGVSPARIVLDLDKVTFIGSFGLSLLLELRATCSERETALVLRGTKHRVVARPLEITGLKDLFVLE